MNGESGSGKSENCKYLVDFFAKTTCKNEVLKMRLLQSLTILEAFGNASNGINPNSTRFAKYFELKFTTDGCLESGN